MGFTNMKRVLALFVAMALLMLAGCNSKDGGQASGTPSSATTSSKAGTDATVSSGGETDATTGDSTDTEASSELPADTTSGTSAAGVTQPPGTTAPTGSSTTKGTTTGTTSSLIKTGAAYQADRAYLYGVGYVDLQMYNRVQVYQAVYLIKALGCRSVRVWANCMSDSRTFVQWRVDRLHELVADLHAAGIQVIFNYSGFESPQKGGLTTWIPARDTTPGSDYMVALDNFETMTYKMAEEFPEVRYWEVGNEWNHTGFINPIGWTEDGTGGAPFTLKEKADISTDLMRRTVKSYKAAGNKGLLIMPALAPADGMDGVAMSNYLEYVYQNIESGNFGSKNPRDFFEALAWHPYEVAEPGMEWVENNHRLYNIAVKHGDDGIKVFLTEYGFPDGGNPRADELQAGWMVKAYGLVKEHMPYVESMHYYRMFTDTSLGEDLYGLMHQPEDGFGPKTKGVKFQEMAGGKGDLYKFFMPMDD